MVAKASPLLTLIARLRSWGPPSLSTLISKLGDVEGYQEFIMLIRDYVPEYEQEILRELGAAAQIEKFASRFEDRYFPLAYYLKEATLNDFGYSDLTRAIPVEIRGFTYDEYDRISADARDGFQLLVYLLESPYADNEDRVALAEACAMHVGRDLVEQVPEGGISHTVVHALFDKSPYKAIAQLSDWLFQDTGNFFLDTDEEFFSYNMPNTPSWDKENVEQLTRDWQQADAINEEINNLVEWLEASPRDRFGQILEFIEKKKKEGVI